MLPERETREDERFNRLPVFMHGDRQDEDYVPERIVRKYTKKAQGYWTNRGKRTLAMEQELANETEAKMARATTTGAKGDRDDGKG